MRKKMRIQSYSFFSVTLLLVVWEHSEAKVNLSSFENKFKREGVAQ